MAEGAVTVSGAGRAARPPLADGSCQPGPPSGWQETRSSHDRHVQSAGAVSGLAVPPAEGTVDYGRRKFNILWSNVQTLLPSLKVYRVC